MSKSDLRFVLFVLLCVIIFGGEPDLHDALITWVKRD